MTACQWCKRPIPLGMRSDAKTCGKKCRQAKQRFKINVAGDSSLTRRMSFTYADPPYPGLAKRYYGAGAQEVNHRILIETLMEYSRDGWALSTSAKSLPSVLALCPGGVRVCAWLKGSTGAVSNRPRNAWEPLIVYEGRARRIEGSDPVSDALQWGGRQHSHPNALVGMKPAPFCEWMFRQLGAERGDTLNDMFPGSGAVSRAWGLYVSPEYSIDR